MSLRDFYAFFFTFVSTFDDEPKWLTKKEKSLSNLPKQLILLVSPTGLARFCFAARTLVRLRSPAFFRPPLACSRPPFSWVLSHRAPYQKETRRHSRRFFINGYKPLPLAAPERGLLASDRRNLLLFTRKRVV